MNKCENCGAEFEGKFCPECGVKVEVKAGKKFCPECGAPLAQGAKFCPECGFSLSDDGRGRVTEKREQKYKQASLDGSAVKILLTLRKVLKFIPICALGLFSVLVFAFFAAPLATFFGEPLCTLYSSSMLSEIGLNINMPVYIVFAVIQLCVAALAVATYFVSRLKVISVNVASRFTLSLSKLLIYIGCAFYFIFFIMGCVLSGQITSAELSAGSCPALLISFTVIFGVFTAAAEVGVFLLGKKFPEAKREDDENASALKVRVDNHKAVQAIAYGEYVKNLPQPAEPKPPEPMDKPKEPANDDYINYKKSLRLISCAVYAIIMCFIVCGVVIGGGIWLTTIGGMADFILGLGLGLPLGIQFIVFVLTAAVCFAKRKYYKNHVVKMHKIARKAAFVVCTVIGVLLVFAALGAMLGYGLFIFTLSSSIEGFEFELDSDTCFVIVFGLNFLVYGLYILIIGCKGIRRTKKNALKYFSSKKVAKDDAANENGKNLLNVCGEYESNLNAFYANERAKVCYGKLVEEYEKKCELWREGKDYTDGKSKIYAAYKYVLRVRDGERVVTLVPDPTDGLARYRDAEGNFWASKDFGKSFEKVEAN